MPRETEPRGAAEVLGELRRRLADRDARAAGGDRPYSDDEHRALHALHYESAGPAGRDDDGGPTDDVRLPETGQGQAEAHAEAHAQGRAEEEAQGAEEEVRRPCPAPPR